ncbi:MAG TPA: cellulose binding domain-containing protein, partial [Phytomonospora sp.]
EGNDDFPVVPDHNGPTPDPRESDAEGSLMPASPSPSPSSKSPTPPPPPPPEEAADPEPLRADVSTGEPDWFGVVESTVVVANPGDEDVDGWTLVLVLPEGMTVTEAEGATYSVNGQKVTFKPDGNGTVPGGGNIEFYFTGHEADEGSSRAESCRINGNRC